ncbi:hypothetical protein GH714_035487 [Hevea brasiliensis]|uniref:Uncharacterized protein n=1 Tax=Hevea brasiliensis TaxID=3981 RepID=A0A6A6L6R6_HEVBR|nr:hypothetical protein GH714_035487 [Hevea brasiliensis]
MALWLLDVDKDLVHVKGRGGITPLRYAAERGKLFVLAEFFEICPESIQDVTNQGDTVFIAVKAINQLMKTHICPNIKNSDGLTVMDILGNQTLLSDRDKMKIQHLSRWKLHLPTARKNLGSPISCRELFGIQFSRVTKISSEKRNALLVVDPLIATVTYQAAGGYGKEQLLIHPLEPMFTSTTLVKQIHLHAMWGR